LGDKIEVVRIRFAVSYALSSEREEEEKKRWVKSLKAVSLCVEETQLKFSTKRGMGAKFFRLARRPPNRFAWDLSHAKLGPRKIFTHNVDP
jgi:hypothetical protein